MSPLPGKSRTRATDDLRLPVPQNLSVSTAMTSSTNLGERKGLLGLVRVVGPRVHLELGGQPSPEPILGQHADHGLVHDARRMLREHLSGRRTTDAARILRVANVLLLRELVAGEAHLTGVH